MMIIDAQIHLWEANRPERPWPAGAQAHLPEPMTAERFIAMMDETGVDRAVISPPFVLGFDPSYPIEVCTRYPDRFATSGRIDLDDPRALATMGSYLDRPGMKAIRLALLGPDRDRWTQSGVLEQFWDAAERFDIPVMVFTPRGLAGIAEAVERHPSLTLIVDHFNLSQAPADERETRISDLVALARFPNVAVKASALPLMATQPAPFSDLHPFIRRVVEAFGANRLMWGSDQTMQMSHGRATYQENVDLFRNAPFLSEEEKAAILGGTAARWLRWP